ncbi:MAG: hypothetical protein Q7T82_09215 [Armatimonadota bacterium]|nr:hypothetical protein [Armatimonadota bacterium]
MKPFLCAVLIILSTWLCATSAGAADIYLRFQVTDPPSGKFKVTTGGYRHGDPWYLPSESAEVEGGKWSRWLDLTKLQLHGRMNRSGGVAEWPSLSLTLSRAEGGEAIRGCAFRVQLADKPDEKSVVIDFTERSASDVICFLLPHPLREKKREFETGSQMVARHLAWAQKATGGRAPKLKHFDIISVVFGYDPLLVKQGVETLRTLGFNVLSVGIQPAWWDATQRMRRELGPRTYTATWHLEADPDESVKKWKAGDGAKIANELANEESRRWYEDMAHYVIFDEIQTMDFRQIDSAKLNGWFRDYLRKKGVTDASLEVPIESVEYPAKAMHEKSLPRDADLPTRKIMYYAGKFGQYWTVKQLRQTTDLVKESFSSLSHEMRTETLPSDHGYFNAWGPPSCGMGYRGLDFFEIGAQKAVDILSAEDWMGLNHMYGADYTWMGAQSFEFLNAIYRSAIGDTGMSLRSLMTPSDDGYLRLKAYSALAQGSKSLYLWAFGPTYLGTENYWSDLRSEYNGLAKITRALEKSEDILFPAKPVRDPVAILYSVSHDLWHTDDPAGLVETRLTWAALRHLSVQPDFLREEDVEAGRLKGYKVLYVIGECVTRKAAAAIDEWVKSGGTIYLSAGAATRDEFYEPCIPAFAASLWPADAAGKIIKEPGHAYNERVDLPTIKPMAMVTFTGSVFSAEPMKAIGYRLDLKGGANIFAKFDDGKPAAASVPYGKGTVYACGFLPGLAYSPFKVGQTTLDEVWSAAPRQLIALPLQVLPLEARAVLTNKPVVEASLLTGPNGSALVLANYTYKPIRKLRVFLPSVREVGEVFSTEGVKVNVKRGEKGVELELPLDWTDIVLLPGK